MSYQPYAQAPMPEPAEAQSLRSMLHVARIIALIFAIIFIIIGIVTLIFLIGVLFIVWGLLDFWIYRECKQIEALVNQRQYEQAKSKTLIWMILGFIIGGILVGIFLLIAYLKFDPLINWQRSGGGAAPPGYGVPAGGGAPPPAAGSPPMAPPAAAPAVAPAPMAAPPAAAAAPICPTCGRPTTFIPQYNRYYCYNCSKYV